MQEIVWDDLDKKKFFVYGSVLFLSIRGFVYPSSLVKTRLQNQREIHPHATKPPTPFPSNTVNTQYKSTWHAFQTILRVEGVRGFYRGFTTSVMGLLPSQMIYLNTLEFVKHRSAILTRTMGIEGTPKGDSLKSFLGGGVASMVNQVIVVPVDVVSQRLQVAGGNKGHATKVNTNGGIAEARSIVAEQGVRGLYCGLGASILTYIPTSAIWWASYGFWRNVLGGYARSGLTEASELDPQLGVLDPQLGVLDPQLGVLDPQLGVLDPQLGVLEKPQDSEKTTQNKPKTRSNLSELSVQAGAALLSAMGTAILTNPLDVAKTRLQLGTGEKSLLGTMKSMVRKEGVRSLGNGAWARVLHMGPVSLLMVLAYETVKKLSVRSVSE